VEFRKQNVLDENEEPESEPVERANKNLNLLREFEGQNLT